MAKHSFTYRFSAIILGVLAAVTFLSCEDRGTDEAGSYAAYMNVTNPSFSQLSAAVLVPKCMGCHKEFGTSAGLGSAMSAGDPDNSDLYKMVASGQMPKGGSPLSPSLVRMIRAYIMNAQDIVIDLNNVTFDVLNKDIFAPRCVHCHKEFSTEQGILDEIEPGDSEDSIIYNLVSGAVPKHVMPKGGHLSQNNIEAIGKFIDALPPREYPLLTSTYTSLNANLFQRSCVQCHSAGRMAQKEPLDTWDGVTDYDKEILTYLQGAKMPIKHTTIVPSADVIKAYSDWLAAGDQNN